MNINNINDNLYIYIYNDHLYIYIFIGWPMNFAIKFDLFHLYHQDQHHDIACHSAVLLWL